MGLENGEDKPKKKKSIKSAGSRKIVVQSSHGSRPGSKQKGSGWLSIKKFFLKFRSIGLKYSLASQIDILVYIFSLKIINSIDLIIIYYYYKVYDQFKSFFLKFNSNYCRETSQPCREKC